MSPSPATTRFAEYCRRHGLVWVVGQIKVSAVIRLGTNRVSATVIWMEHSQEIERLTLFTAFLENLNKIEFVGQSSHGLLNIIVL